ncbi:type I phosphodiesterase/nucleotide pyrophosphatase family protein [Burkholderia pseudomallei]|uniref:Type I phosphodiesterase/nucleotide pyrophosphatase family protein n=4 Tax=Burkholderia pseudomallei TaxID=28450 RepID=Q3JHN6_BURP1|nr:MULTISPECIES: alkaline phosphatase family protein [Burkholderia]EIF61105.1 type I phosphodiesterase/nucleotide pyrophosphatase family protein [Burkholderia pseudomallei 1258a]ABA52343.1 type I phosphodiesterase/nucleotide pyrophosphatase family protein [Burkholderia pseudomallei 1710b]AFI68532.1 type I phosphodiesterase/nucleotide pyrophosphatase family protein [Burkholderia pseudomallei 1026b]AFR18245.1 type I phosphodiesterase / nucleotide pyrophosphatase [Burkholderia pseudomallei BPC006]
MKRNSKQFEIGAWLGACALAFAGAASAAAVQDRDHDSRPVDAKRVLLVSIDGLHEQDLARCIGANTCPNLALLAKSGVTYTNARTPGLSDSFPGLAALVTGGSPKSAGLFYDVSYDRTLYAPSDATCSGKQGWNVVFDETTGIDAMNGGALTHLDGGGAFNPQAIPHARVNGQCVSVYPHDYVKTNTVFEVVKEHLRGSHTAWADKHAWGYDWVNGPSGKGVDDLARTEINSIDPATGTPYTDIYTHTEKFDDYHVQAIVNQIDGKNSTGTAAAPVPTLFGTNFQTLSVAQKATVASGGGYLDASFTPGPEVANAIAYVDGALGRIVAELRQRGLYDSTVVIVTAKHGQSPTDHTKLVKHGDTLTALLEANGFVDPNGNFGQNNTASGNPNDGTGLVGTGFVQTDDVGLVWLRDPRQLSAAVATLKANLGCNAPGICADGPQAYILYGPSVAERFGNPALGRTPDIVVQPNPGVIYTSSKKKDEEHGGNAPDDSHLGLLVSYAGLRQGRTIDAPVLTTQVAPTILRSLGLEPRLLHAVALEGTRVLPGLGLER